MKPSLSSASLLVILAATALAACSKKEAPPAAEPAAAPAPVAEAPAAPKSTSVYNFKVGDLAATSLLDGGFDPPNDNQVFGVGLKPEDVAAVLAANGADKLQLFIEPLLVKTADHVMLFDAGAGGNFGPGSGKLLASMQEAGVDPASVTDIFISHVHGDHIGGLANAEGAPNFPNATIHISNPEWTFLTGLKDEQAKTMGLGNRAALVAVMKPKVKGFTPGAELVPGVVTAVEIKGHTPGHSGYKITSGSESLLYVGDSMHQYIVSVQKPEWTNAYDGDNKTATASRVALIKDLAATGQRVYAVHFPFPGVGHMEKKGEGVVWVAE